MLFPHHKLKSFQSYATIIEAGNASTPSGKSLRTKLLAGFNENPEQPSADGSKTITIHDIPLIVKISQTGTRTVVSLPNDHDSITQLEAALKAERAFLNAVAKASKTTVAELVANGPKPLGAKSTEQARTP